MTLDEVKARLQKRYQIENFIDLAEFDNLPTGRLYSALRKCHKIEFADNERLVFVAGSPLKKTFEDQPHDIITVLQQYLQHHDIPHFFVIVLSNIPTMKTELKYVHSTYNAREPEAILHLKYE